MNTQNQMTKENPPKTTHFQDGTYGFVGRSSILSEKKKKTLISVLSELAKNVMEPEKEDYDLEEVLKEAENFSKTDFNNCLKKINNITNRN